MLSTVADIAPEVIVTATLVVDTRGQDFVEITHYARRFVAESGVKNGALLLFVRHTSASLIIQENATPRQPSLTRAVTGKL